MKNFTLARVFTFLGIVLLFGFITGIVVFLITAMFGLAFTVHSVFLGMFILLCLQEIWHSLFDDEDEE